MPHFLFVAKTQVPPGAQERFAVSVRGGKDHAIRFAQRMGLGSKPLEYAIYPIPETPLEDAVVAVSIQPSAQLSPEHVSGGQPTGQPRGIKGQDRPQGQRDVSSGFQTLADGSVETAGDTFWGTTEHGTHMDLYQNNQEVARPNT